MEFSKFTFPEIEFLKRNLNLTEEELKIFEFLCSGNQIKYVSYKMGMSQRTVDRRIKNIKNKIEKLLDVK